MTERVPAVSAAVTEQNTETTPPCRKCGCPDLQRGSNCGRLAWFTCLDCGRGEVLSLVWPMSAGEQLRWVRRTRVSA
jgi:hypothetical protein